MVYSYTFYTNFAAYWVSGARQPWRWGRSVAFHLRSEHIPDLLAEATFLVHTSDSEGYPNVIMEAMACGRAVVATDAGDVPSLVEDGKNRLVAETLVAYRAMGWKED